MCSLVTVGGVALPLFRGDFDLLQVLDFDLLTQRLCQRRPPARACGGGWGVGGALREVNHTGKVFALAVYSALCGHTTGSSENKPLTVATVTHTRDYGGPPLMSSQMHADNDSGAEHTSRCGGSAHIVAPRTGEAQKRAKTKEDIMGCASGVCRR